MPDRLKPGSNACRPFLLFPRIILILLTFTSLFFCRETEAAYYAFSTVPATAFEAATTNVVWEQINTTYPQDDDKQLVNIGFTFNFGGVNYTQVRIHTNGVLDFGADQLFHQDFSNENMPIGTADRLIAPYWDDLDPAGGTGGGTVRYDTLGTAPNRRLVVSWENVELYGNPATSFTFQAVLYENGDILFRYGAGDANGASATIGVEVGDTDFTEFSFNTVSVSPANDILFTPLSHFAISHDGIGDLCQPEPVTISYHDPLHAVDPTYTGIITLSTSTAHGDWNVISGNPANLVNSGSGDATYTFDGSESGVVVLGLANTFVETLNIDVTDGTAVEDPTEDPDLIFSNLVFETFRDEFNNQTYNNNDGTLPWAADWVEINDDGNPTGSDEVVMTDLGADFSLRIRDNNGGGEGVERGADLSAFTAATLSFDYRREGLDNANDYVAIWVYDGATWAEIPGSRITGPGTDGAYQSVSYDLTPYIAANFMLRLLSSPNMGNNDEVFFDNIQLLAGVPFICPSNHFSIVHDGFNDLCRPENITISFHDSSHVVDPSYTGTITLSTSTAHGDWSMVSGVPANLVNSGNGDATYAFDGSESGVIVLGLANTFNETLNIDITDGTFIEGEDPDLLFANLLNPGTYRDEFNAQTYNNNDGTLAWATDWVEINDDGSPTGSDEVIMTDLGADFSLRVRDNNGGGEGVERGADLSGFTAATLSFDYRRQGLDNANDYVAIWVYDGATWAEIPGSRITGPGTDGAYQAASYDLTPYIAANFMIRLLSSPAMGNNDIVFFDNIEISDPTLVTCTGPDHYALVHDGAGVNCQAESVTFEVHDATHAVIIAHTGAIDLSTNTGHGDWSVISGVPANLVNSGGGIATYTFDGSESGLIILGLKDTFVESININVTDGAATELTGTALASEDLPIAFAQAGFNFLADGVTNTIGTQIGGKPSNIAPGNQVLELQAIRTSDSTGQCESALQGANTIDLAFECLNPATCTASQVSINGTNIGANDSGPIVSYNGVNLDFGNAADTTATITMTYPDAGQIRLHARYNIPLGGGGPSGNLMTGSSNNFVVRPFGFDISAAGNPAATTAAGVAFTPAGTSFNTTVRAVLWQAGDDTDFNGIPDGHGDTDPTNNVSLIDNIPAALNFGQETVSEDVVLSSLLFLPVSPPATDPGLAGTTTVTGFIGGASSSPVQFDEVGIVEISADLTDASYLGDGSVTGRSGHVGRFYPDHFLVSIAPDPPTLIDSCAGSLFTYLGEPFGYTVDPVITITAENGLAIPTTTLNYDCGGFWKLPDPFTLNYTYSDGAGAGPTLAPAGGAASPAAGDTTDCTGSISMTINNNFTYSRPLLTAPVIPFPANINLAATQAQFTDSDTICFDTGTGCQGFARNGIVGASLRLGQSIAANGYAPETVTGGDPLLMRVSVLFYNNAAIWVTNTDDDSCSQYTYVITPNGTITVNSPPASPITFAFGDGSLGLWPTADPAPPGGTVDLSYDFPEWLEQDPTAGPEPDTNVEAFFGIYRGNDRIINWKEIVR